MSRYEGVGEVGFAPAAPGELAVAEVRDDTTLVCQAESLIAMEAGIQANVVLARRIREAEQRTKLAMIRLTGKGVAFLCAHGTAVGVDLAPGETLEAAWWAVAWYEATAEYEVLTFRSGVRGETRACLAGITGPGRVCASGAAGRYAGVVSQVLSSLRQPVR